MEGTIQFIEIIKRHSAIYDTTNKDYKNMERKANAWMSVANELGLNVDTCKRKWKNLRDSYTKYLRSYRAGTKASKKYQSWAHAEHMDFLRPFQGPGRTHSTAKVQPFPNLLSLKTDCSLKLKYEKFNKNQVLDNNIEQHNNDVASTSQNNNASSSSSLYNDDDKNLTKQIELDATSMFFLSLAKSVRSMPRKYQVDVKMRCMKIVSDVEMELENSLFDSNLNNRSFKLSVNNSQDQDPLAPQTDNSEHFLYVMSPSKVEAMIDISSDDEHPDNRN